MRNPNTDDLRARVRITENEVVRQRKLFQVTNATVDGSLDELTVVNKQRIKENDFRLSWI